jgi:hypothetical protein
MGLGEEDPDSTRWGRGDGRAAGTEDVGGPPCRRVALAVVEVGGRSPYVQAAGMRRWPAAVRWVVANGWEAGLDRPGEGTCWRARKRG